MSSRSIRVLLLTVTIIALCWRFYDLDRDPVPVSASLSEILDPAGYLYNARSFALTGDWRAQGYQHIFRIAPGFALLAGLWMKVFGIAYGRIVLLPVVSGFVVIACTAYIAEIVSSQWSPSVPKGRSGLFVLWSFGISYVFYVLQQVAKGDMESMAISACAALLLISLDRSEGPTWLPLRSFAAGIAIGIVPLVKLHAAMFSVAALLAWCLGLCAGDSRWRLTWKQATPWLLGGLFSTVLVWIPWYMWTNVHELANTTLSAPFGESSRTVLSVLSALSQSNLFYRHPVEIALATLGVVSCIRDVLKRWSLLFCGIWFVLGGVVFSVLTYSPTRYRLLFAVPTLVLASHVWTSIASGRWVAARKSWTIAAGSSGLVLFAVVETVALQYRFHFRWPLWSVIIIATGVTIALAWTWRWAVLCKGEAVGNVILGIMMVVALPQWIRGESHRDHVYRQLALRLAAENPEIIFGGGVGCQLALWTNDDCSMDFTESARRPVTHLFLRQSENEISPDNLLAQFHETARFALPGIPEPIILYTRR